LRTKAAGKLLLGEYDGGVRQHPNLSSRAPGDDPLVDLRKIFENGFVLENVANQGLRGIADHNSRHLRTPGFLNPYRHLRAVEQMSAGESRHAAATNVYAHLINA
jgi:hypothetical protein